MSRDRESLPTDPLAEKLSAEGRRLRPEFSEGLHARLCAAVRGRGAEPAAMEKPALHQAASWVLAAAAAAVVFVASAFFWQNVGSHPAEVGVAFGPEVSSPSQSPEEIAATAALVETATTELGSMLTSAIDRQQWAGLDHDARAVLETVAGPLPFDLGLAVATAESP